MRADNTRHLIVAARQRHELTRAKAIQALRTLDAEGRPVTFEAVAQAAAVSRSWLYAQSDVRAEIERLRAAHRRAPATPVPARQRTSDASLLRRLEAANQRNRKLAEENRTLRDQLARALGQQRTASETTSTRTPPETSQLDNDRSLLKGLPHDPTSNVDDNVHNETPQVKAPNRPAAQDNSTPSRTFLCEHHVDL